MDPAIITLEYKLGILYANPVFAFLPKLFGHWRWHVVPKIEIEVYAL
jgi:hypothetical protein